MATFNAVYIRSEAGTAQIVRAVRWKFWFARVEANAHFVGARLSDFTSHAPERDLLQLSSRFQTDVLWMSFQSVVDAFEFHHWRAGARLRSLVYGATDQFTWERVEGTPEPWEREVFFDREMLVDLLADLESEDEKRELERIWRDAEILSGGTEPFNDVRIWARRLAERLRLPDL